MKSMVANNWGNFIKALKDCEKEGFAKPISVKYEHGFFKALLEKDTCAAYKKKLESFTGDEVDGVPAMIDSLNSVEEVIVKTPVDKPVEKEDIVIELVKSDTPVKPKRASRKKT